MKRKVWDMVGGFIAAAVIVFVGVNMLTLINSKVDSVGTTFEATSPVVALTGMLPVVFIGMMIIFAVTAMFGGAAYVTYKKWTDFGHRLKLAYEGKFGYRNSGFDEEVDACVRVMRALGHGPTKDTMEERLRGLARFVEVPFIIPEEDHLAEEVKTEELSGHIR